MPEQHDTNKRFCISHIILSVFLFAAGIVFGWWFISSWIHTQFNLLMLLYIPAFCVACVLPLYASVACAIEEFKKLGKKAP